jgi:hypothetical protein
MEVKKAEEIVNEAVEQDNPQLIKDIMDEKVMEKPVILMFV